MTVLVNKMNVFRTNIHFGLCTTLPDHVSRILCGNNSTRTADHSQTMRDALRVLQCGALLAVLVVVNAQPHVNKVCRACYGI